MFIFIGLPPDNSGQYFFSFLSGGEMSTQGTRRRRSGSKAGSLAGKSLKISTDQKIKIAKQGSLIA